MIQKMIIQVDSKKPFNEVGEDHVLLYDASKKLYFAISRDTLLSAQNAEIKKLQYEMGVLKESNQRFRQELEASFRNYVNKLEENFQNFKNLNDQKYREFLILYQETNNDLIQMVKSLMKEEK